jgi:hypothetical protein
MSTRIVADLKITYDAEIAKTLTVKAFLSFNEIITETQTLYYAISPEEIVKANDINSILVLIASLYLELEYDGHQLVNTTNEDGTANLNPTTVLNFYLENDGLVDSFEPTLRALVEKFGIGVEATVNEEEDYAWEVKSEMHLYKISTHNLSRIRVPRLEELEAMEKKYKALNAFLSAEPERLHTAKTLAALLALTKTK